MMHIPPQPAVHPHALIFANGDHGDGDMPRRTLAAAFETGRPLVIAADGGARNAAHFGLIPQHIIGDMDSLDADELAAFEAAGAQLHRCSPEKDETDLELALCLALEHGANWIRIFGAVGDRLDQTLSNIYLLGLPALADRDVRLVAGRAETWLIGVGEHRIAGTVGDTVSLLPLAGDAGGITTDGLHYPLRDETLYFGPARGVSNVMRGGAATVRVGSGLLMVVHTLGRA